ncbi:hypothetical protein NQ318_023609 [Aromia moschata]|uniref:PiggyBac transposable element-derived protein domain-containing protein n=1 Tax=Aromia moschata TaxID=1265417 RepID=A0AAV8YQ62_9CUCU|nr:hypothetical protein NQ318_023609 [Aromia moschata]
MDPNEELLRFKASTLGDDSEPEPCSGYGEFDDVDYVPPDSSGSESESDQQSEPNQVADDIIIEGEDSIQGGPIQKENNSDAESEENDDNAWEEVHSDIPNFGFDGAHSGIKIDGIDNMSPVEVFRQIWNDEVGRSHNEPEAGSKTEALVLRILRPYLNKGHHIYMDNFYNSVPLSSKLLTYKTHTIGTLRANRRGNPGVVIKIKLRKGEHIWRKKQNISVYVSKWKDKRDIYAITTGYQPRIVTVRNRYGVENVKPCEVDAYNQHMSGIDRSDQMMSYYSCPRKTIRWYKKVIFHLLDVAVWNAYFLYNNAGVRTKRITFVDFREAIVKSLTQIEELYYRKQTQGDKI